MKRLERIVPLLIFFGGCTTLNSQTADGGAGTSGTSGGSKGMAGGDGAGGTSGASGRAGSGGITAGTGGGGVGGGGGSAGAGGSATGTGGSAGDGGHAGSGGMSGTGGHAGSGGGSAGAGGGAGKGGSSGAGGHAGAAGGTTGAGGQAGGSTDATDAGTDAPKVVAAPRLIAPLSTATVTSQRPTLRWSLAAGTDGAHVQICRDRACTVEVTSFDAEGASAAPTTSLPAGLLFWHAYGRSAGTTGSQSSATWEMTVGARSAPVNASWGTTLDVNGDGYADVIVGAPTVSTNTGRVYVYLGSATGVSTVPTTTLTGPDSINGYFGCSVASAGDVNGDGYADVIVGAYAANSNTGRAYLYLGSATGISTSPTQTITGFGGSFGYAVASAGDVNGDGYADVVIGAYLANSNGRAYVYLGAAAGLSTTPATTLIGPDGASGAFGFSVASAGDVNGDGYADVVVSAYMAVSATGRAYLYLGSAAAISTTPTTTLTGPDGTNGYFGMSVRGAGDVNGDGYADLVVGAGGVGSNGGRAYLFAGSAAGISTSPTTTLVGPDPSGYFGIFTAGAGDVNGDGYADVLVGANAYNNFSGRVYLYLGSATGLATSATATFDDPGGTGGAFSVVSGAGDVNRDGYADVLVGAPDEGSTPTGQTYLYLGSASGLPAAPTTAFVGPDGASGGFGTSVASAGDVNGDTGHRACTPGLS
jgi:hypothetical protein